MKIKWASCFLFISVFLSCSLSSAVPHKQNGPYKLKVLSVIANRPNLVPQSVCNKWLGKEITIQPALTAGETPEFDNSVFYLSDKGIYNFKVNNRAVEVIYTIFHYQPRQLMSRKAMQKDDGSVLDIDAKLPVNIILPKPDSKNKDSVGYVDMRFCTALVERY